MRLLDSFWAAIDWLRALFTNWYFWGGVAGLATLGLCVYLVVDGMIMPAYTRHDVSITVPDVENRPFEEGDSLLSNRNLQVERQVGRYNPNVEQGIVVDQTPLPNSSVKPGRRVYLTVNAGEVPMVQIPDVSGMSVREAKNRISSLGLSVGAVQEDPIPSPYANTITKQTPAPGDSLRKGESVNIWYSTGLGDAQVEVPNVVGWNVHDARTFLRQEKLRSVVVDTTVTTEQTPTTQDQTDDPVPARELYVQRQGRPPGSTVRAGTEIRLFTTMDQEKAASLRDAAADTTN